MNNVEQLFEALLKINGDTLVVNQERTGLYHQEQKEKYHRPAHPQRK